MSDNCVMFKVTDLSGEISSMGAVQEGKSMSGIYESKSMESKDVSIGSIGGSRRRTVSRRRRTISGAHPANLGSKMSLRENTLHDPWVQSKLKRIGEAIMFKEEVLVYLFTC